jgi:hypothetical protein
VQPQPPDEAEELEEDFAPLEGAAKTDSWIVCFALAHFGQAMVWL